VRGKKSSEVKYKGLTDYRRSGLNDDMQNISVTPDKEVNILHFKWSGFLAHPVHRQTGPKSYTTPLGEWSKIKGFF